MLNLLSAKISAHSLGTEKQPAQGLKGGVYMFSPDGFGLFPHIKMSFLGSTPCRNACTCFFVAWSLHLVTSTSGINWVCWIIMLQFNCPGRSYLSLAQRVIILIVNIM